MNRIYLNKEVSVNGHASIEVFFPIKLAQTVYSYAHACMHSNSALVWLLNTQSSPLIVQTVIGISC